MGSQPQSLLVVEDDEATAAFLADNLAADGYGVAVAAGAGEGLRAIEVRSPSLVVLDLLLEEGNGLDLLDRVRASDGLATRIDPDLPVIVVSGRTGEADRVRGFARGADDYVVKPLAYFFSALASDAAASSRMVGMTSPPLNVNCSKSRVRAA